MARGRNAPSSVIGEQKGWSYPFKLVGGGKGMSCPFKLVMARDLVIPSISVLRQGTVVPLQIGDGKGLGDPFN